MTTALDRALVIAGTDLRLLLADRRARFAFFVLPLMIVFVVGLAVHGATRLSLGIIDPSRAPDHGHVYDEVIYVVEGEGTLHLDGTDTPIGPGSCIHLPPLVEHCLENHGPGPMRVLGVFHPAGDPAGRA